jgi:Tol biopolymer transport system component
MRHRIRRLTSLAAVMALAMGLMVAGGTGAGASTAPNGLIAYSSWDANLNYDIYTVDPTNPQATPLQLTTDGRNNADPDWSPDGTKIVYDGWSTFGGPRIQVMDADPATDDSTVLSQPCAADVDCYGDFQPSWSPDGTKIAFVSSRPNADGTNDWMYQIYVMDATGEVGSVPATRLTDDPAPESGTGIENSQVTWSPDGTRMAFLSTGRGSDQDSCDLWAMDSRDLNGDGFGDNLQRLTSDESFNCDAFEDVSPQWSPNASLIAFTSVRSGYFDIWVVNADDPGDLRNVTRTPTGYEDQPNWSPDGTQIIFRSSASGSYELYSLPVPPPAAGLAALARPKPTQLTFDGKTKQQPDWGAVAGSSPGTVTLTVTKVGHGHVSSRPSGLRCGVDCSSTFVAKSFVTLRAVAGAGSHFLRWGGACAGTALPTCTAHMNVARRVFAKFVVG